MESSSKNRKIRVYKQSRLKYHEDYGDRGDHGDYEDHEIEITTCLKN